MKSCSCRISLILIVTLLTLYQLKAQVPQTLDSVRLYLKSHTVQDTSYVIALNVLGRELHSSTHPEYAAADSVLQLSEKLALKLQYGLGLAKAYTNRASIYYLTDHPQLALTYFQKALAASESYTLSPRFRCGAMANVAAAFEKLGLFGKAVAIGLQSLRVQEQYNIQPRIATTYGGIGNALRAMKKYPEALTYYRQGLALAKAEHNPRGMSITENNMGICYDELKRYDQSIPIYKKALQHAREVKFDLLQADILVNIGLALNASGHSKEAIPYVEQSLAIGRSQNHKESMATAYFNLGRIYEDLKQDKPAEVNLKKALTLATERGDKEQIANYTQALADLYGGQKNFQQAYVFQLEKNKQIDSATTIRTSTEVQRLVAGYETEKKEAQIKLLRQQAQLRDEELARQRLQRNALLVGGLLLLLLGASVSGWLLNRSKLKRLQEAQTLRKQIAHDLHDEVGSTLSSISLLSGHTNELLSQNRPESAQKMVQKIYTDARQILESIDEIIWTINPGNDSLQRIALRLQAYAQPLMESKHIAFNFIGDASLDQLPVSMEVRRNLYLIGKEAINNLIKYSEATQATLRFERKGHELQVVIEDNGKGFTPALQSQRTGQTSMRQRAEAMGGTLAIHSVPEKGTSLIVTTSLS
ncbi:tetratricopeptide repeat-containing sensor histidine kinase [Spirosoma panaciterrae]|uniref:tetratricopeptide repeat-containing sensor histidine kinase n=1 Tax=Spirosoma panaciterrae TaxID=496058 RepID=UPI00039F106C|nr:tetratricopeptide repeat-containing sensor histidine kinase [Spirosoma panaciterrae]